MVKPIEMRLKTAYQPHITCAMPTKQVVSAFLEQKIVRIQSVKTVCAAKLLAHWSSMKDEYVEAFVFFQWCYEH